MQLLDLPALTHLWKGPTQLVQLRNLTSEEVKRCDKLKSMFLVSIARDLRQLQTLKISRCCMMEVELIAIEKLLILSMHNVMEIWPGKHLQKLRDMIIFRCPKLLNVLFPCNLIKARLLVKLQEIKVTECGVLEAIIGEEPKVDDKVIANIIMFPQLSSLKLYHLPNLRSICPQAYVVKGSFLKKVEVINCPNMKALPSAFQGIPELQESNVQKVDFFGSAQHHL
ncbi:hypothetical protein ACSBR2_034392 [Camellia fascicularis]